MAYSKIALVMVVLQLCCATRVELPSDHQHNSRTRLRLHSAANKGDNHHDMKLAKFGWNGVLVPIHPLGFVDSDTRPIRSRERRQTGTAVGGNSNAERRSQRVTSAPLLQGLSLLDLPVFSRGDRPSSMDKTLGAIFSKVAFSATNQSGATGLVAVASSNKNSDQTTDKVNERNAALDAGGQPSSNGINSTATSSTTTEASTSSESKSVVLPSSSTLVPIRSKPVFEFDTRVFDFIPYDRTPTPSDPNRQYNPNVPGLRGPSRINTARNPGNNQPFNLRPTLPPLVDLSGVGQSGNRFVTTIKHHTTTTVTPSTTTESIEDDEALDTTTITATSTTTTTVTPPSTTTVTTTNTPPERGPHEVSTASSGRGHPSTSTRDVTNRVETEEQVTGADRDAAWSIQVYGTSTLFALLGLFALSNLMRLRSSTRRLLNTSHCLSIQLLVLFLAITRSIHLLYDAYNHRRLLPPALAFSIFNVAFPCLSSALAVLLLGIFKATKLQVYTLIVYTTCKQIKMKGYK
jgi:hypothetical protein